MLRKFFCFVCHQAGENAGTGFTPQHPLALTQKWFRFRPTKTSNPNFPHCCEIFLEGFAALHSSFAHCARPKIPRWEKKENGFVEKIRVRSRLLDKFLDLRKLWLCKNFSALFASKIHTRKNSTLWFTLRPKSSFERAKVGARKIKSSCFCRLHAVGMSLSKWAKTRVFSFA